MVGDVPPLDGGVDVIELQPVGGTAANALAAEKVSVQLHSIFVTSIVILFVVRHELVTGIEPASRHLTRMLHDQYVLHQHGTSSRNQTLLIWM